MNSNENSRRTRTRDERGVTLIEILVAVAIFAVAAIIALTVFDLSRRSFKKGENLTENQQAVRIAFDRLAADLRMTGFNYNPDGAANRPDEQIEAAFDTAVVIRADFDAEDPIASQTPESTLIGSDFLSVSIGNDEIVAYVLAKPDGSSAGNLTFRADISTPRDGTLETVTIPNVAMVQNDPPYTLYRVTFDNDDASFGSAGFFVRTPLIENVYSMNFRYYNQVGVQANTTFDLTTIADDIGGLDVPAARIARAGIRRYGVELVGMTRDPDPTWIDEADPIAATRPFRKFTLTSDIQPRNIGMVGAKDLAADVTPPTQPATPTVIPGHCGGLMIAWSPNPTEDEVAYYRVNYSLTSGVLGTSRTANSNRYYLGGLNHATTYYVTIQAVDGSGNVSVPSSEASTTTTNVNTPLAPANVTASTTLNGVVAVEWDAVTQNTSSDPSQDPAAPLLRDLEGYRVYRGISGSFGNATLLADESVLQRSANPSFPDDTVVNCRDYNYWVTAVDACGVESDESIRVTGNATTSNAPSTPQNVQAFWSGLTDARVEWEAVTTDDQGEAIYVDSYRIYKTPAYPIGVLLPPEDAFALASTAVDTTVWTDSSAVPDTSLYTVFYKVSAIDDCGNESILSPAVQPNCAFAGNVAFSTPSDGQPVAGVVPVVFSATSGGTETYLKASLTFTHRTTGAATTVPLETPGPTWTYDWLADPPGPYTITATVVNDLGCSKTARIEVAAGFDVGCCLSPPNPELNPILLECTGSGGSKCAELDYEVINNNCLTAVAIERMEIRWVDNTGNDPKLTGVLFDGSFIWNPAIPVPRPASNAFSDPKPSISIDRDALSPVRVTYTFDANMGERLGQNRTANTLTTTYSFRLLDDLGQPTSITGVCGPSTGMFDNMIVDVP